MSYFISFLIYNLVVLMIKLLNNITMILNALCSIMYLPDIQNISAIFVIHISY